MSTTDIEKIAITIGPDPEGPGIIWQIVARRSDGNADHDSDGADDEPVETPSGWLALAEDLISLPAAVEDLGLLWNDATVTSEGWSQGAGHAPQGIRITWDIAAHIRETVSLAIERDTEGLAAVARDCGGDAADAAARLVQRHVSLYRRRPVPAAIVDALAAIVADSRDSA